MYGIMTNNNIKNNKTKTITTIITAMVVGVVLFASMNANAYADNSFGHWSKENYKKFLQREHAVQPNAIVGTFTTSSNPCTFVSQAPPNNCNGYNVGNNWPGMFYYATPYSYLNDLPPGSCNYACANTDIQLLAPSQVEEGGYVWTFSSASSVQCAPNLGLCTNSVNWTSTPGQTFSIFSAPTGTPIQQTTTYLYSKGSDQIQIQFTNYLQYGYQ